MKKPELAHAYVTLDRFVFFQLQKSSRLRDLNAKIKQRIKENEGSEDFRRLCNAGAEEDELLWLLGGCEGLPGFAVTQECFGWTTEELTKGLDAIEKAASVIQKMQSHTFGILARYTPYGTNLDKNLRSYLVLAREARRDFGHRSEWFLNIAKARLVIHVNHRTNGDPHDREVSGLIAAITGSNYNADAQRRWRNKHRELFLDNTLDPYTVKGHAGRELVLEQWNALAVKAPEFYGGFDSWVSDYAALNRFRQRKQSNRRNTKTTL